MDRSAFSWVNKPISQSKVENSGGPLDNPTWHTMAGCNGWFSYSHNCTLYNGAVFQFCLPSLNVQWAARMFHF